MTVPSMADSLAVLLLQAADNGRGPMLFGDSLARARAQAAPFMVGGDFPNTYLEFPLIGDPFLDVTVLYKDLDPGVTVDSPAAEGSEAMLAFQAEAYERFEDVNCGFELDTKAPELPRAAIHFQPRKHRELVAPFCEAIGEPERAQTYLDFNERLPEGWELSFFGLFRGRPGGAMRVCGYLPADVKEACVQDPGYIGKTFDEIGFSAYDEHMLSQVSQLMRVTPGGIDFQFDVYPDGHLSEVFAIDAQFGIEQPEAVMTSFTDGPGAAVMRQLQDWGVADGRWRLGAEAAFARALPVVLEDGSVGRFAFTLMPQWVKARWINGVLQPSKLYLLGHAGLLGDER